MGISEKMIILDSLKQKLYPTLPSSPRTIAVRRQASGRMRHSSAPILPLALGLCLILALGPISLQANDQNQKQQANEAPTINGIRSTQPTVDRQVDTPVSSPVVSWSAPTVSQSAQSVQVAAKAPEVSPASSSAKAGEQAPVATSVSNKYNKPKQISGSQKKAALASQQNYDKYQLKATNSYVSPSSDASSGSASQSGSSDKITNSPSAINESQNSKEKDDSLADKGNQSKPTGGLAHKKSSLQQANNKPKSSSFSLLKKLLPSFMTSAGPMAAAAAAAAGAVVDKHQVSHSRSSQSNGLAGDGMLGKASGKIINLLSSKKSAFSNAAAPDHAFFIRKPSIDRQAGFASGLLSNPLSLGLLFSAPLIPSLLLTPLAIAGLSPAMSAINNFFGDDEEASTPASSPLSVLTGPSSPLSSILQGTSGQSPSGSSSSFALQAVQSILGPPATTEKPLFKPGMFASQGIQNAIGSMSSSSSGSPSSSSSSSSSLSQANNSPIRNFLGGNLIQTAASMISPSFAAPSSASSNSGSSSSSDSDDGPGFMQVASDVFDKVANYMSPDKDIAPAASTSSISSALPNQSPLSALVGLSNFSPFQLSSLLASGPFASAIGAGGSSSSQSGSSSSSGPGTTQRAGFFSTLKNVYELFSSSFLRRQEVGDSNECQQRLVCELHQRAMNSKLFRRSLQSNLLELANFDKSLQEQIKSNPMEARVDAGTKAMLNDFLKATNNFKNGRELVNCSKMFPKCSRAMLLSTANAHLTDPTNSKAIGKFSSLMKKMKFKSAQQHQSQWKLRKPTKSTGISQSPRSVPSNQYQAIDYQQVAPLSSIPSAAGKPQVGQLTPADSLKLVQQIMLMSQQQQQQQQQSQNQQQFIGLNSPQAPALYTTPNQLYSASQQPSYPNNYAQYQNTQNGQVNSMYSDTVAPVYSSTDSPYYIQPQQDQQQQQQQSLSGESMIQAQQLQAQNQQPSQSMMIRPNLQQANSQLNNYQQYPTSTSAIPEQTDKKVQSQQQQGIVRANAA